jgi:hypothetical protein
VIAVLNIAGLILNAAGVILLFYFAMPYRTRTGGKTAQTVRTPAGEQDVEQERVFDLFARTGLSCILVGTALQIWASWHI